MADPNIPDTKEARKHLPGPWSASDENGCWVVDSLGLIVAEVMARAPHGEVWTLDNAVTDANRNLLVAAPEMLEALEHATSAMVVELDRGERFLTNREWREILTKARAAIAKARGKG